nr:dTDP-4-dehydrorhamnose reductase [Candidatus Njordarchaeum guaymaensis]
MRVLITGGTGLLGLKLLRSCRRKRVDVYAIDTSVPPPNIDRKITFIELDITDAESITSKISELKPDVVMNTAAMTDVDLCEVEKENAWRVNADGAKNVAEACSKIGAFLIQVSTGYVFEGDKGLHDEDEEPNPLCHYGFTKLKGEEFVKSYATEWCIARTDVLFGWGRPDRPNFATWVVSKLEKRESIKAITDQYCSPTLNTNLSDMMVEVAERKIQGILNMAGATRINRFDLAKKISKVFQLDEKLIQPAKADELKWKAKRPKDSSLKVEKAKKILSHKPLSIDEALKTLKEERESD